jgi:hypothetical protein
MGTDDHNFRGKRGFKGGSMRTVFCLTLLFATLSAPISSYAIPLTLRYQGHVRVQGVPFEGVGQFKFALLDGASNTLWSHDGSSVTGAEPTSSVGVTVQRGIYEIGIGDVNVANMAALPNQIFANPKVVLRVWFNDNQNGFQQLTPDREISAVAFAIRADSARTVETLPEGLIEERHLPMPFIQRVIDNDARIFISSNILSGRLIATNNNLQAGIGVERDARITAITAIPSIDC